jgi:hypothetical protein
VQVTMQLSIGHCRVITRPIKLGNIEICYILCLNVNLLYLPLIYASTVKRVIVIHIVLLHILRLVILPIARSSLSAVHLSTFVIVYNIYVCLVIPPNLSHIDNLLRNILWVKV